MPTHPDPHDPDVVVVLGCSGGKDSTATSLYLREQGIEHRRLFADTGWEHPDTYDYVRDYLPGRLGPIDWVRGEYTFEELVEKKGMFPGPKTRFCTTDLKVKPIIEYLERIDAEVINVVGIRAAESQARAKMPEWEWSDAFDCWVWRPIIAWTEQDVIDMHQRNGMRPNPLYLKGARRVGCFPCRYASKQDLDLMAEIWPERVVTIRDLERRVQEAAAARYAAKGETFESLGYTPPTMFTLRAPGDPKKRMAPVDEVMEWAKTAHGGRQLQLFNDGAQAGCMRWGLCDAPADDPQEGTD